MCKECIWGGGGGRDIVYIYIYIYIPGPRSGTVMAIPLLISPFNTLLQL